MLNNDRYYEPEDDEPNSDEIEYRTAELMKTKQYDPYQASNVIEALHEMSHKNVEALQLILDTKDFTAIGRKIWSLTYDYMEGYALAEAESEFDN